MENKRKFTIRLFLLAAFLLAVLLAYLGILYDTQVVHYEDYLTSSIQSIMKTEKVEASRGIITDRNGVPLITNASTYNLTFDSSLLKQDEDPNLAILRLVQLCQEQDVSWIDSLPISQHAPYLYTLNVSSSSARSRFLSYLLSLPKARQALGEYLLQHPELLPAEEAEEESQPAGTDAPTLSLVKQAEQAARRLTADSLTAELLNAAGLTPVKLLGLMQTAFKIPDTFSQADVRLVSGVQYELNLRKLGTNTAYVMAEDLDIPFISILSDGNYSGAKVSSSSRRQYETTYGSHILGTVSRIYKEDLEKLAGKGYDGDDWIGRDGVELAFEEYLKGTDGRRVISTNSDGKITGEYYSTEPEPGCTVELTIDIDLQQVVEDTLAATVQRMTAADGDRARGAACVVEKVGTGEILAMASYPNFDLSTFRQNYAELSDTELRPDRPLVNRATQGAYPPGSTLKPLTTAAALESGVTTPGEKLFDSGKWSYPNSPQSYTYCWNHSGHGWVNASQAITNSCNYYFAEMGYRMGMKMFREYLTAYGLGENTGVEIGDRKGLLPENPQGQDQAPWAAYGQASQVYTPIQLANYIATLVSGGKHCQAHLLKTAKTYDGSAVVATGNTEPLNVVPMQDSTLNAVKTGMHGYTLPGGSVYPYFKDCVVSAGAKTGTAQLGGNTTNNGVFVCFAPYENPEIAISIVIERGTLGANLASTAVTILNYYFSEDEIGTAIIGENQLLP